MKTTLKTFALLICLTAAGMLTSCTKEAGYLDQLLGKWQQITTINPGTGEEVDLSNVEPYGCTVEFKNDGTFIIVNTFDVAGPVEVTGTFRIRDNQLEVLSVHYGEMFQDLSHYYAISEINAGYLTLTPLTLYDEEMPELGYFNLFSVTYFGKSRYKRLSTSPLF